MALILAGQCHGDAGAAIGHGPPVQDDDNDGDCGERQLSHGCASGQIGLLARKWQSTGISRLPREALNIGVVIIEGETTPTK